MGKITIAIVGSRKWRDRQAVRDCISVLDPERHRIISGGARGVDSLARRYANEYGIEFQEFPANWDELGKRAGMIRNGEMIKHADVLYAFILNSSNGTQNMIDRAERKGLKHIYVDRRSDE